MCYLQPIRNQEDHQAALTEIERIFDAPQGTPEFDKLDILATLVEAYENSCEEKATVVTNQSGVNS